jgi:hypothetical protein
MRALALSLSSIFCLSLQNAIISYGHSDHLQDAKCLYSSSSRQYWQL